MKFSKLPETAFEELQVNAGVLLSEFDPASPGTGAELISKILWATTGGMTFHATPTYADFGEDIDNCPKNMKELKRLQEMSVILSGTGISVTADGVKRLFSAADKEGNKITPRSNLLDTDFADLWFVGDYSSKNGETSGGYLAIHMLNTLSTGGFQWKSADKAKGKFPFEFTAHYTMKDQTKIPVEVYVQEGQEEAAAAANVEEE